MNPSKTFMRQISSNAGIIHWVLNHYCDSEEDKKDLQQDILLQAWRSYPSFRQECKFSTWLHSISTNVAVDFRRRKRRYERTWQPPDADWWPVAKWNQIVRAVNALPLHERVLVEMYYFDSMPKTKLAGVLGLSGNALAVRMNRINGKIKNMIVCHNETTTQ